MSSNSYANRKECEEYLADLEPVSCLNCRWFRMTDQLERTVYDLGNGSQRMTSLTGDCVRHSPVPLVLSNELNGYWPPVEGKDFCGDFVNNPFNQDLLSLIWMKWNSDS